MNTSRYFSDPALRALFGPAVIAALAVAVQCGVLSVFVVLRRLAFVGHGVSHAAFGGVGVAAVLGFASGMAGATTWVVAAFCVGTALLIGVVAARSNRAGRPTVGALRDDTVIGITLVGAMALGAVLLHLRARSGVPGSPSVVDTLFGSVLGVRRPDAWVAWIVGLGVVAAVVYWRRPLLLWAFDEPGARSMGVRTTGVRLLLMTLLGLSIVVSMRLAGVLLVTALLVLPGAIALRLTDRLGPAFALSTGASVLGVAGGVLVAFEFDLPPGPSVVGVLIAMLACASALRWARHRAPKGRPA